MTVDDIKKFYGLNYDAQITQKIKVSKVTIGHWREKGIPIKFQGAIQVFTNNALLADAEKLKELFHD